MKKGLVWVAAGAMLAGCGGGGDGGGGAAPASPPVSQPAPVTPVTPPPPPPPPPPTVSVLSASVVRQVAADTGIAMDVVIKPSFTPTGTLYAGAVVTSGLDFVPAGAVTVTPNTDGTYTLGMSTKPTSVPGNYTGEFTVQLCSDPSCTTLQAVPSIKVPYAITVAAANSAWPGDKITPLTPWADVPDWSTFQGNAAHTGHVPVTLNPDQFSLRWKTGTINPNNAFVNTNPVTLTSANGLFYSVRDNKLHARKELDGSVVWSFDASSLTYPTLNPPAVDNGIVYMVAGHQSSTFMFGFDAATGSVIFRNVMWSQWESHLAPVAMDNKVYINSGSYNGLSAFSSTGEKLYQSTGQQYDGWSPAVDTDSVYVYTGEALTVHDRRTGVKTSSITDPSNQWVGYGIGGAPVLASKGMVLTANYRGASNAGYTNALTKFNVEKGYIDWRVSGMYPVTPAYADGIVYALNKSPFRLEVRSESDAALKWSWTPQLATETGWAGEPVVTKNMVFISTDKNTYAIDLRTRKPVWTYPLAGRLALTRSGILYIHSSEALVAINVK